MRHVMRLLGAVVLGACATPPPPMKSEPVELDERTRCDPVSTLQVRTRVDGARVLIESVVTQQVCEGEPRIAPPERLAEIRLRSDQPACPVGQLGAQRWSLAFQEERALATFFQARTAAERARLELALTSFSTDARAWVIGCPADRPVEWLFIETPRTGFPQRVAFYDGDRVRASPGHENVVFPAPPPPPVTPAEPPLPAPDDEAGSDEWPAEPPPPTSIGCPAETIDAQWVARRFTSHAKPPGERSMPGPETLDHWRLRLDGANTTLVHELEKRQRHASDPGVWACSEATTMMGTLARRGRTLTLTFGGLVATCREETVSLPAAGAKRQPRRLPQRLNEEGCDRYPWATSARVATKALVCTGVLPLNAMSIFGSSPGLERLALANDCQDPNERGALRLVPADGGVAPAL